MEGIEATKVAEATEAEAATEATEAEATEATEAAETTEAGMDVDESLRRFGLVPSDEALPEIRAILAREAEAERRGEERVDDLAVLCCVQLFSRGKLEDVLRIWDAKSAGMDLGCMLDVQFLCGAGVEETKRFLAALAGQERVLVATATAAAALRYLVKCEEARNFEGFSPEGYLARYRAYFARAGEGAPRDEGGERA